VGCFDNIVFFATVRVDFKQFFDAILKPWEVTMTTNTTAAPSGDLSGVNNFVHSTIQRWYGGCGLKIKVKPIVCSLVDLDWHWLGEDVDPDKFGEYTLNSGTSAIQWGTIPVEKFKVIDFKEMIGRPLFEVAHKIVALYGGSHEFPGVECQKYFIEHPDPSFDVLKPGLRYFFLGSIIRNRYGHATIPNSSWDGGRLRCDGYGLCLSWTADIRVVLVEK